jgi:hypothetical protein
MRRTPVAPGLLCCLCGDVSFMIRRGFRVQNRHFRGNSGESQLLPEGFSRQKGFCVFALKNDSAAFP